MRVGVVVATLGRPVEVGQLLRRLREQTLKPSVIVLSVERPDDLPAPRMPDVEVVFGARGLPAQRNRGMAVAAPLCDVMVFYDDDYLPCRDALGGVAALFREHPDVAGATGRVLLDGIGCGGIDYDHALGVLERFEAQPAEPPRITRDVRLAYGCNMAFRTAMIADLKFDERLPLYGWQEDVDFAARVARQGRMVRTDAFSGVHRGVTKGRTSGLRFGFSQIVNPLYLMRKGTMTPAHALRLILRNLLANHGRALRPEAWIDRRGRVHGNWLGLREAVKWNLRPEQILEL